MMSVSAWLLLFSPWYIHSNVSSGHLADMSVIRATSVHVLDCLAYSFVSLQKGGRGCTCFSSSVMNRFC